MGHDAVEILTILALCVSSKEEKIYLSSNHAYILSEYLAHDDESDFDCENSDKWNCKYCQKTDMCRAQTDPKNFGKPNEA